MGSGIIAASGTDYEMSRFCLTGPQTKHTSALLGGGRRLHLETAGQQGVTLVMKWIHVWASPSLPVIVLDSPFVFHAWLPIHINAGVWRHARSPYQWQQSSVINKLRIFFALICLEAFFQLAPAETCLALTAPLLPCLIGLEGNRDKYTSEMGFGEGRMKGKQVMKSFQNYPFNCSHCDVKMSGISLAWSIMGGGESPCEGVWINFWKH